MRKFIFYSTVLMIFSDHLSVNVASVNLFAAYVIVVVNLCLILTLGKGWFPRGVLVLIGFLMLSGFAGLMLGTVSQVSFAKDFCGILPNAIYACAFIRFLNFEVEGFFAEYAKYAFYVAIIGLLFAPFQLTLGAGRFTSIMLEPSSFCVNCVPAVYYYADQWHRNGRFRFRFFVLLLACVLTFSSVGYLGLLFSLYLFGTRYRFGTVFAPVLVLVVGLGVYNVSGYFQVRLDDTLNSMTTATLYDTNLSSYGVAVSAYVTEQVFERHPITGGGLGSYVIAHDKFAPDMPGYDIFAEMGMGDLARWDASSLLLRVISEFGIVGLAACIFFLCRYFPWRSTPERRAIAMALLSYVFMKCVRSGTYFNPEEWLFFVTYGVNGMLARSERRLREQSPATAQQKASPLSLPPDSIQTA